MKVVSNTSTRLRHDASLLHGLEERGELDLGKLPGLPAAWWGDVPHAPPHYLQRWRAAFLYEHCARKHLKSKGQAHHRCPQISFCQENKLQSRGFT